MTFTVSLDRAPEEAIVVNYAVDASGTANAGNDFTVTAGAITFAAGQKTAQVQVNVLADQIDEADETVVLKFSGAKLAADVLGSGTIVDDDASFVFTSAATIAVAENATAVVTVTGADADDAAGTLKAELSGADAAKFDLVNGNLVFKAAPNFEAPADAGANNVYNVSVTVTDPHGNATKQDLAVTVTDANEAPTAVALTGKVSTIAENTAVTTRLKVADIAVTDDALGTETYTLSGADAAKFEVVDGALYLKAGTTLNFEAQKAYDVTVNVADATLTGSTPVTVSHTLSLTDVNEAPTPVADGSVSVITGNSVTLDVLKNDTDPDTVAAFNTLTIAAGPTATVGTVSVVGNKLVYKAPDGFQGKATISYAITDGTNTVAATQDVSVGEPAITAAKASVNEGENIVFSIKGVANTEYSVELDQTKLAPAEAVDGIVKVKTDANGDATLTIKTLADRTTEGAQGITAKIVGTLASPVSVSVVDSSLNNIAPVADDAAVTVAEGAAKISGQLVATDADAADAGKHTFTTASVVDGFALKADGSYTFDPTNAAYNSLAVGEKVVKTINFTVNDNAVASGNGALTDTGVLTITVTGTNDTPVVTVANAALTIDENTTTVSTFTTSDVDTSDKLGEVQLSGEDAALFQIVGNTLAFRTGPDFEKPADANRDGVYNVTLNVTDNNGATGSKAVVVTVANTADVVGAVTDANAAANAVNENSAVGTLVGVTANAVEPQAGDTVRYSLTTNPGNLFAIDPVTGVVTVNGALNFEVAASYTITVQATSSDGSTSSADFTIAVNDVAEAVGAVTDVDAAANTVAENAAVGTVVGITANAVDPQAGDIVKYSLTTNPGNRFAIDADTGVVTVAGALDFETAPQHTITVEARSSDGSVSSANFVINVTDTVEAFTLTSGGDSGAAFTAGAGADTFNALDTTNAAGAVVPTWTVGDAIDGGLGADVFNVTQTAAVNTPLGATVVGIETMNVTTSANTTLNTVAFTGLTALNVTDAGNDGAANPAPAGTTITAAGTTAVTVNSTPTAAGLSPVTVNGGSTVAVTTTNNVADVITVGNVTAPTGAVTVNSTAAAGGAGAINVTAGAAAISVAQVTTADNGGVITTTGGDTVTITQSRTAAGVGVSGAVNVNGGAATTTVSVTDNGVAAASGVVTIIDGNSLLAAADTIATVTLAGAAAATTIQSGALTTLNVSGASGGVLVNSLVAAANQTATTLGINLNGAAFGANAVTLATAGGLLNSSYTTVNLDSSTAASVLGGLNRGGAAEAVANLNITGNALLTLGAQTALTAAASIVSTNTAGVTLTTALLAGQRFTGGTGVDTIEITGGATVAHAMGGGDDVVTITGNTIVGNGMGPLGSLAGDAGRDTLVMASGDAIAASANQNFNNDVSGFEVLRLSTALVGVVDVDGINNVGTVVLTATGAGGTVNNIDSGGTVNQLVVNAGTLTVNVDSAALNAGDVLNVGIGDATTAVVSNFGILAAANVETINITTTNTGGGTANTLALTGSAGLTTVTVTGTGDLALTSVATVSNINAATLVGGVTVASNNVLTPVTFTGGTGNDNYTGTVVVDTVNLASGGSDTVVVGANLAANGLDTVNSFSGGAAAAGGDRLDLNGALNPVALRDGNGAAAGLIFNTATAAGDLVIAGNDLNAYVVVTGTATLPGGLVTVGTGAVGEIVVGDRLSAYILQADNVNSTSFNLYRVFDGDGNVGGIQPTIELMGVVSMTNAFSTLTAFNIT